ncbi:beta-1,6-glucan synthase [Xanthobacter dioxanivorans]|uniref:Endo-1,3-beta-glucanase btgC n=1 Tax=Xanthobacter dioxanivorans TaxID=2528964 RepID=A0A974PL14_9HYPH|nr:glycosyl hydrolase family 17 protein [Xanthobacter dioxanivorans]QRG05134.1 beta-1,6-glucan synthase [Xanthobacter dioxanivorans]
MPSSVRLPLVLALVVAGLIAGLWTWVGRPVAMPPSPLAAGEKLPCVSYAPFRDGQSPFQKELVIPEAQIDEDFAKLAQITSCVRTYATEKGLDKAPMLARKHGLTMLLGIWLGPDVDRNRLELDTGIRLAQENPDVVKAVVVGNEVLLRGEMSAAELANVIASVKRQVAPVPVTYADVWEFWERNKGLTENVDFVTIHILPYWEDLPVAAEEAGPHVDEIRQRMAEAFPGKEILIGETGWPSAGRMREEALPSPSNQARVMHDVVELAKRQGYRVNVIEAFDQPWKRRSEGTVGGHWGLIDSGTRAPKFAWGEPVSDFPGWRMHIAVGLASVVLVFGSAFAAGRRREDPMPAGDWFAVAAIALCGGATLGAAVSALPLESLGFVGWLRNGGIFAVAVAGLAVMPAVIGRGQGLAPFSVALDARRWPVSPAPAIGAALMLVLACVAVGSVAFELVFDPRYKDFPVFPLTAIVAAVAAPMLVRRADRDGAGLAEPVAMWGLLVAGLYVPLNETLDNWQAAWFGVLCLVLSFTLWRVQAVQRKG